MFKRKYKSDVLAADIAALVKKDIVENKKLDFAETLGEIIFIMSVSSVSLTLGFLAGCLPPGKNIPKEHIEKLKKLNTISFNEMIDRPFKEGVMKYEE